MFNFPSLAPLIVIALIHVAYPIDLNHADPNPIKL